MVSFGTSEISIIFGLVGLCSTVFTIAILVFLVLIYTKLNRIEQALTKRD